jgi:ferredoxin
MDAEVYYFSGTGNSLFAAKEIAEKISGKLVSIPSVIDEEHIRTEAGVLGIVFPVYYAVNDSGIPLIVSRFVRKLESINSKHIFAVCTCGYMPGATIENMAKLLKFQGGELAAGFILKMSNGALSLEKQQKTLNDQKEKLNGVCEYIRVRKKGKLETRGILRKIVLSPLLYLAIKPAFSRRYRKLSGSPRLPFSDLIPIADRSFRVDSKCIGCGICAQVCPVNNITMVSGKPQWQHHCETCYACYTWCPQAAIGGDIVSYNKRYHHSTVKLPEMLGAKK